MDDCISRQEAIDALEKVAELFPWRVPGKSDTYDSYNEAWNDAIGRAEMEIESLLSAQPEIIRCKDCRYAHLTRDGKCKYCDTWTDVDGYPLDLYVEGEFYCGNAERRTDG